MINSALPSSVSITAVLSLLAGPRGATGGARGPEEPLGSQRLSLPANHREAAEDFRGDHRRPRLLKPGKSAMYPQHGNVLPAQVQLLRGLVTLWDLCRLWARSTTAVWLPRRRASRRRCWQPCTSCCCASRIRAAHRTAPPS